MQGQPLNVVLGRLAFSDRDLLLGGNGRACADCHNFSNEFQLSPANAQARYNALQTCRQGYPNFDDPLFRAIDADDFRTNGANAQDFTQLTQNGLIRITMPLPPNVVIIDPTTNLPKPDRTVDVWRAVPFIYDVAITGPDGLQPFNPQAPNVAGGYQRDARIDTLQNQAQSALFAHIQIQQPPSQTLLDDFTAFENTQFSNSRVAALAAALAAGTTPLPSTDGPLTDLEQQGKAVFIRSCGQCHGNNGDHPSTSTPIVQDFPPAPALRRYHNINTTCPRPAGYGFKPCPDSLNAVAVTYQVTLANGTTTRVTTSDGGRGLTPTDALVDPTDLGRFDVPSLFNLSNTAPYFHNNTAATLDEVLDQYAGFFAFLEATKPNASALTTDGVHFDRPFTPEERPALIAYLQTL